MASNENSGNLLHLEQSLENARRNLDEAYRELGIRAHELIDTGRLESGELIMAKLKIDTLIKDIADTEAAMIPAEIIEQPASPSVCSSGGAPVDASGAPSRFSPDVPPSVTAPAAAGAVECPGCHEFIDADSIFCGFCGAPVTAGPGMVECANCGNRITADSVFCGYCGTSTTPKLEQVACPSCRNAIDADSAFCGYCGGTVENAGERPAGGPGEVAREVQPALAPPPPPSPAVSAQLPEKAILPDPAHGGMPALKPDNAFPEQEKDVAPAAGVADIPSDNRMCRSCGKVQRPQAVFCCNCGDRL